MRIQTSFTLKISQRTRMLRRFGVSFRRLWPRLTVIGLCLACASAQAQIRVEVEGLAPELKTNVLAFLSLSRYETLTDLDEGLVGRLQSRAQGEIGQALQPFGFYEPKVTGTLTKEGAIWVSRLTVDPGAPVILVQADVSLHGSGAQDPVITEGLNAAPLTTGTALNHLAYTRLKAELLRRAYARGYLDAQWLVSELSVDSQAHEARAHLSLQTGERYRFGEVSIDQPMLKPDLMRRYVSFSKGDWFDSNALLKTQFALDDSAYFGDVQVRPAERDHNQLTVPVSITATAPKRNKYTFGAGYSTDQSWRVTGTWESRILNDSGHRFRLDTAVGSNAQSYGASYTIPVGNPVLEKIELGATQSYASPGNVHSIATILHSGLTQVRGAWQYVPSLDVAHTVSDVAPLPITQTVVVPGLVIAQVPKGFLSNSSSQTSIIGSTPGALALPGNSQNVVGGGFYAEILGSAEAFHSDLSFLQLRVRDEWRYALASRWRLLLRGEVGLTIVRDFDQLPVNYRFFAGGDQSVRGYAYQSLSPVDQAGEKAGGKDLLALSTEVDREITSKFALAVFVDGGNAIMHFGQPLAYGAGVGVRFRLPFLSMGVDIAKPLSNGGGSPRLHLNISPVF